MKSNVVIKRSIIEFRCVPHFEYRIGFEVMKHILTYQFTIFMIAILFSGSFDCFFERNAKMKFDVAGDALLSELDEEYNKNIKGRCDSAKQYEKTTKNKKSDNKNRKKNKLKVVQWPMQKFVHIYHHSP